MNFSISSIGDTKIFNSSTREELISIEAPSISQDLFSTYERPKSLLGGSATFELETTFINNDLLTELFIGDSLHSNNTKIQFDAPVYKEQIRSHKKKRINKKWAKKYGYRDVMGTYEADTALIEYDKSTSEVCCEFKNLHVSKIKGKSVINIQNKIRI